MILITGAAGFVGRRLMETVPGAVAAPSLRNASQEDIRRIVEESGAEAIIHTAAISDIGACQADPEASYRANVQLPLWLAKAAGNRKLICFSSDQVYSGSKEAGPYSEEMTAPGNVYACHKLEMEQRVLEILPEAVMLRAEWMYDLRAPKPNYLLNVLRAEGTVAFSSRQYRGVTYLGEVAENMDRVLALGAKAVVIACNTATGEAVDSLRAQHPDVPIIGVEPAVKPAVEAHPGGTVLVLATPMCLQGQRFRELMERFSDAAEVVPVPCGGLMEFVERGELEGVALQSYLQEKLAPWQGRRVDAAVLGCTHYPFLREAIAEALGPEAEILDGNAGVTAQLHRRLKDQGLLNPAEQPGSVTFYNSLEDPAILELSRMLLELP